MPEPHQIKKVSIGQKLANKTKRISDNNKLNSEIYRLQRQLYGQYHSLGQDYYERHKDDKNPEFQEQIMAIQAANEDIVRYREQINRINGVTKCQSCGAFVSLDSSFCNECGAKIILGNLHVARKSCPNCWAKVGDDDLFCIECGTMFSVLEDDRKEETVDEMEQEISNTVTHCPNCQSEIGSDDLFCISCGAALSSSKINNKS